jgi:hypothetical protein
MSRPLRCTERCCDRCPAENSVAGKYLSARSISVAAGLGFPKQRLGPRRRNAQRVATSLTRRSNLSVTFADRIGNVQRGIGPLHLTGMFPGELRPPEEWITSHPEVRGQLSTDMRYSPRDRRRCSTPSSFATNESWSIFDLDLHPFFRFLGRLAGVASNLFTLWGDAVELGPRAGVTQW